MSKADEDLAARLVSAATGIALRPTRLHLGQWGQADCYCEQTNGNCVILEAERGQKHPTTNVAKLWPWLEEDVRRHAMLIHVFFEPNAAPHNRRLVTQWLGERMARDLADRFAYYPLTIRDGSIVDGLPALIQAIQFTAKEPRE